MISARHGPRPPWWPESEPWPPYRVNYWRRRRHGFLRRLALVLVVVLGLSAIGAGTIVTALLGRIGINPLLLVAGMLVLMAGLALVVMGRVGRPLGDLVSAADRLGAGDYDVRVAERGAPFLRILARSFNGMASQLQAQDRQRRQLMADIAHELRTPLSVIQGRLEGLVDGVYPRDEARMAELLEDTRVLARLVEDLRTLATAEAGNLPLRREPTDLSVLLHEATASFAAEARAKGIDLRVEENGTPGELPLVEIDPLRVREVLTNLLANALRHTGAGGRITVSARAREEGVEVGVRDTGSGIPPEELPRIFDRFYKGAGSRGSGLGLTIARNLVVAHGGSIVAESEPGRGTLIRFTLPLT